MRKSSRWMGLVLVLAALPLAACTQPRATASSEPQAKVEPAGGGLNRVTLTRLAAERLGIQTAPVREERVARKRTLGGDVLSVGSSAVVRVRPTPNDLKMVDQHQPAQVRPLAPRNTAAATTTPPMGTALVARAADPKTVEAALKAAGGTTTEKGAAGGAAETATEGLFYVVDGTHGLAAGQRVLLEAPVVGSEASRKVVPYSAVIYDVRGDTYVYTQPAPQTFVRQRVTVDRVDGNRALLVEGPPAGTEVVTAGATELFGTELKIGK